MGRRNSTLDTAQAEVDRKDQQSLTAYKRLRPSQMHLILMLHAEGKPQLEIADLLGVHNSTISRFLSSIKDPGALVTSILKGDAIAALTDWKRARRVAAKRGDHRPAREWLEAGLPELRPATQASAQQGSRVTIVVGTPEHPARLPNLTIDVLSTPLLDVPPASEFQVSPVVPEAQSETEPHR